MLGVESELMQGGSFKFRAVNYSALQLLKGINKNIKSICLF